ncbi:sensor histidine kinase [Luteimonas notoginsengisoli]|uniref:histidine kinase n=1 Tax=Luteimonas notoginsengisoli TaxID=1578200 RepID=A0ABV7UWF5_9GAMM
MPHSRRPEPTPKWRLALLLLAVALIVVVPAVLLRTAAIESIAALEQVNHSQQVEAQAYALAYDVRNVESAVLATAAGVEDAELPARLEESRMRIAPALDTLQALTRDNPGQQVRVGHLRANVEQRMAEVMRGEQDGVSAAGVEALVTRFPIRGIVAEMVAEERKLLAQRVAASDRTRSRAELLRWGAMLAQLALLGTVTFFASRQIAGRLSAERSTRRASARAAVVLDTVREPIVLADAGLRVVMHNAAFAELFGIEGDATGALLAEVGGGAWNDEETLRRLGDVMARDRELWDFQRRQETADGFERVMLINARRMSLPDSEDDAVLITASDITSQKASELQIRELNRQLEGKVEQVSDVNRELEAFSYSVSHDLRAPLRHIAGFADKLGRQLGDDIDDKSRHYLNVISGSARRMSALIDDLLVYSRLGRSALRPQVVDLQSMIHDTRSMLDANAHADNPDHVIHWRIGPMPVLVADENMLRQVWLNLLGNAVKYSARSEPAVIEVSHDHEADGSHRFSIRDNGAGFDMAYAGKLFGVFQRLHAASEFSGTGIGLASVKRVITRHEGRIWAESEPGKGATFHFTLPGNLEPTSKSTPTA